MPIPQWNGKTMTEYRKIMIRTEKLTRDYGNNRGIFNLTMQIPKGKIFGFIGPNGSGKTTTIKLLCGLYKATSGKSFINNVQVIPKNYSTIKRTIGYMPDKTGVYDQMSVWEYLDFFCATYRIPRKLRRRRIEGVLELANAAYMLDYQVNSLSQGMAKRVALAKTLLHDPAVLILDEPASGLDPYARIEMRRTIMRLREVGKTIMLSSHILPELSSVCDLVGIVEKGRLLDFGTVREIVTRLQEHIVIGITVQGEAARAAELCSKHANVKGVTPQGNEVRVVYVGPRSEMAEINRVLVENKINVIGFREEEGDLEEAFLRITRKQSNGADAGTAAKTQPKSNDGEPRRHRPLKTADPAGIKEQRASRTPVEKNSEAARR